MQVYRTKNKKLPGSSWKEVNKKAYSYYKTIVRKTKRRPYVRSAYFDRQKIFLGLFWSHLHEKLSLKDKTRRVRYFQCAIELIEKSYYAPSSKNNPNRRGEVVYRFAGITADSELFFVQIKEAGSKKGKWLISVFPAEK